MPQTAPTRYHSALATLIFLSRWLQAPLYLGPIVAQGVYVYHFLIELGAPSQEGSAHRRENHYADGARTYRCGHDRQSSHHGHRRRLRDIRFAFAPREPSGPT